MEREPNSPEYACDPGCGAQPCDQAWLTDEDDSDLPSDEWVDEMGRYVTKPIDWRTVFIDVCTQQDYLGTNAILQVTGREQLVANLKQTFSWVRKSRAAVVSILESHRPTEPIHGTPLHCIDGTVGQRKPGFTLLKPRILIEADNTFSLPHDLGKKYRQLMFRKRTRDILSNHKADRLLTQLEVDEFIILGVGLERAIRGLALGLLSRHKKVTVVSDACGFWSKGDADLVLRQLAAKGIRLITTAELLERPTSPVRRYQPTIRRANKPTSPPRASRTAGHRSTGKTSSKSPSHQTPRP